MQAIADHVYHILIIAFVATTIVEAIVKFAKRPRKRKRSPAAPRESAIEREKRMRERYAAFGKRWREWLDQPRGAVMRAVSWRPRASGEARNRELPSPGVSMTLSWER